MAPQWLGSPIREEPRTGLRSKLETPAEASIDPSIGVDIVVKRRDQAHKPMLIFDSTKISKEVVEPVSGLKKHQRQLLVPILDYRSYQQENSNTFS